MKIIDSTRSFLISIALSISAVHAGTVDTGAAEARTARPSAPGDFSTAMQRLEPLSSIKGGADSPICHSAAVQSPQYAHAVDYAESMGSYSLIIWKNGECLLERYFPPFDRDLRPESASMHKSIVGILVAAAIADGHIEGPDVRIGKYIGEWNEDPRGDITLRQLLTMSSGLKPMSSEGGTASEAMLYVSGPEDVRQMTLDRPLRDKPGTVFNYLGLNSQLLLMILETATGMDYVDYASERLWRPLDAADAYVWDYVGKSPMPRAHLSLLATARDWLKVGLLLKDYGHYNGRQVIPRHLILEATTSSQVNPNYAWHMWLGDVYEGERFYNMEKTGPSVPMSEPFAVDDLVFFDGFGGQRVYISRKEDLVIVRQGDMRLDWDDAALPNLVLRALQE